MSSNLHDRWSESRTWGHAPTTGSESTNYVANTGAGSREGTSANTPRSGVFNTAGHDGSVAESTHYSSSGAPTTTWTNDQSTEAPNTTTQPSTWYQTNSVSGSTTHSYKGKEKEAPTVLNYAHGGELGSYRVKTDYGSPRPGNANDVGEDEFDEFNEIMNSVPDGISDVPVQAPLGNPMAQGMPDISIQDPKNLSYLPLEYYVASSSEQFAVGSIFWAMERGEVGSRPNGRQSMTYGELKARRYEKPRMWIVVRNTVGHSDCVKITTNSGRGSGKSGAKLQYWGYVYTGNRAPDYHTGWPPVKANITLGNRNLVSGSMINYSEVQCIQHNIYVCHVGNIDFLDFNTTVVDALQHALGNKTCYPPEPGASQRQSSYHHKHKHHSRK